MIARAAMRESMRTQRGAVLFVSTIILLVLSLLAVAMAKSAVFENRMVGAARSAQLAQLAADSAMSEARAKIARVAAQAGAEAVCAALRCAVRDAGAPVDPVAYMRTPAAQAAANPFRIDLARLGYADATAQLAATPVYVVEDLGNAPKTAGSASSPQRLFRITARGVGASEDFSRVVESVYAVAATAAAPG
ncbi:MAG: pilus assembly protein [Proteobacteria bacterium]|uniref:pilus assembly PilX family protein n=1 Tax=Rudaea sp. TaxID=2136325 RepID=UPI001E162A3A|nr:pilus assembly protein [Pseudomonadota bacterium]MBS0567871.1 pilus assembly protein [Pseudomonadota bacterium]